MSWVTHHREGFVIDWMRQPTRQTPVIHRATCRSIRAAHGKTTHWTTGRHLKACSLDRGKLVAWVTGQGAGEPVWCRECLVSSDTDEEPGRPRPITKLGRQILDFVVEVAVIHLDKRDFDYRLTVDDVAHSQDKTVGQIAQALLRLVQSGYLNLDGPGEPRSAPLRPDQRVFPTASALQNLPAFENQPAADIHRELQLLRAARRQ